MAPPPPHPATSDGTKRNGGAPQQLGKLDLAVERQKSGKFAATKASPEKLKPATREPQEDDVTTNNQAPTKKRKSGAKASKTVKVAVADASVDQFNDIGEITKSAAATGNKAKATTTAKPRPASAGVGSAKPASTARPASAGGVSPLKKTTIKQGDGQKTQPSADSTSKLAFVGNSNDAVSEPDDQENRSLGDKEPEAKGLYDIFVQTRRCEKLCYEVGLKLKHIRKMKKKFDDNDMYHTGEITQAEFFFIINEERRPLTKGILQYGKVSPDQKFMSFDEFLLCVVSFAVLTPPEVYQYAFDLYDADQSGTLDEYEFAKMSKEMQSKQFSFPKNTQMAIKMIEGKDTGGKRGSGGGYVSEDGLVDLAEFMKFAKLFPVAFYPLFNFQKNVRRSTLGESKWSRLAARKLKIQDLVSHMRRNYGAIPELSFGERLWSIVDDEVLAIRKRASEIYGQELNQRRLIGDDTGDNDDS